MQMIILVVLVLVVIFETVKSVVEIKKKNKESRDFDSRLTEHLSETRVSLNGFLGKAEDQINQFTDHIKSDVFDQFAKELEKAEQEKWKAISELNLYVTAIRSLDPNYRKKIQTRVDAMVNRSKQQPVQKDKG